ncbi:MAG: hypothetical protein Q4F17_00990 [Eubacteriales bacterium]|nr:hypothetical protein [Eubacteriales bacterium]
MTELETLQRAKMYMEQLANGIDPITNAPIPEQDVVNNVRLSRCFFYVCGVLDRAIEQERKNASKNLPAFHISVQEAAKIPPLDRPVGISQLAEHISRCIGENQMRKLSPTTITSWLVELGILEIPEDGHGKRPTSRGISLGISTESRMGANGEYTAVLYAPAAQQFILDNLPAVLDRFSKENHGAPWSRDEEDFLIQQFQSGVPLAKIAMELKRTREGIRKRLKKLGVLENQNTPPRI